MFSQLRGESGVHFTRSWVFRPFVRFLEQQGCPTERHLLQVRLSPDLLEDDDGIVPVRPAIQFVERASRSEGIDHLGLRAAQSVTVEDLGFLRAVLLSSRNLHEYLQSLCRLASSISTSARYAVCIQDDTVRFHHKTLDVGNPLHGHLLALGLVIHTLRAVAGEAWRPSDIVIPGGTLDGLVEVSDAFEGARIDPAATSASFDFPRSFLALPPPRPSVAADVCLEADFTRPDAGGFRHAARTLVECLVLDGFAKVHTAADAAGMSVRTFQRRLAECGLVFSQVVQEARIDLAERWLREDGRSVNDVAHSLGYTDPANFTRAFRRMNGMAPSRFKASNDEPARMPHAAKRR